MLQREAWLHEIEGSSSYTVPSTRDFKTLLTEFGWSYSRQSGSHESWTHKSIPYVVTFKSHDSHLSPGTFRSNLNRMGISVKDITFILSKKLRRADPERLQKIKDQAPSKAWDVSADKQVTKTQDSTVSPGYGKGKPKGVPGKGSPKRR